jgi:hypothetical protein
MKHHLVPPANVMRRSALVMVSALALVSVSTPSLALADTVPPTRPATPTVSLIGPVSAIVNTGGSTDNDRVAGYYVQRQVNGVWTDWSSTLIEPTYAYLLSLTPGTAYTAVVVAFDPSGNRSQRSDPVTFTTTALPAPTCKVVRQTISPEVYILNFFIENMTASVVVTEWTMTFTMPSAQTVSTAFSSTLTRSGDAATLRAMPNTARITPGMTAFFGLYANRPAASPLPSGFTLTSPATGPISCAATDRTG